MEGQRETCRSDRRRQSLVSIGSCPRNGSSHQTLVHLYHREGCPVHYDHLWMDHFDSKWKQTQTQRDTESHRACDGWLCNTCEVFCTLVFL
jgi:hypothetical protein